MEEWGFIAQEIPDEDSLLKNHSGAVENPSEGESLCYLEDKFTIKVKDDPEPKLKLHESVRKLPKLVIGQNKKNAATGSISDHDYFRRVPKKNKVQALTFKKNIKKPLNAPIIYLPASKNTVRVDVKSCDKWAQDPLSNPEALPKQPIVEETMVKEEVVDIEDHVTELANPNEKSACLQFKNDLVLKINKNFEKIAKNFSSHTQEGKTEDGKNDTAIFTCSKCSFKSLDFSVYQNHVFYNHQLDIFDKTMIWGCCDFDNLLSRKFDGLESPDKLEWFECDKCCFVSTDGQFLQGHIKNRHLNYWAPKAKVDIMGAVSFEPKYVNT